MTYMGNHGPGLPYFDLDDKFINMQWIRVNQEIHKIDSSKSIHLTLGDQCEPKKFANQNSQILVTNNRIVNNLLDSKYYELANPSIHAAYGGHISLENVVPDRAFNCFINRMDVIRQSWLYQLVRRNIFDQGYVSFNMDISRHHALGHYPYTSTAQDIFEDQYQKHLTIFQPEHEYIRSQVPYHNFDLDLNVTVMRSKFSIVLETYASNNDAVVVSEKTYRVLKLPRPWLLFAMKHAVQYVRDLGFDVLDDIVDHSYDNIEFDIDRQVAILNQAEQLVDLKFTDALVQRLNQAALHNQNLLKHWQQTFHADFLKTISRAKEKCLDL